MPRLLLIEDEIGAIAALKRTLARAGHEVLVATNLPDALSTIEHEQPDALLVAAGLQGESAASLVEAIRAVDVARPLIVMGDGLGTGEPFLSKPVEPAKLIELLHELVPGAPPPAVAALAEPLPSLRAPPPANEPKSTFPLSPRGEEGRGEGATPAASTLSEPLGGDLIRRRELVSKTLAEAQVRRQAAEAARTRARLDIGLKHVVPPPAGLPQGLASAQVRGQAAPRAPAEELPASPTEPRVTGVLQAPAEPRPTPVPPRSVAPLPPSARIPARSAEEGRWPRRSLDAELFGNPSQDERAPAAREDVPFFQGSRDRFAAVTTQAASQERPTPQPRTAVSQARTSPSALPTAAPLPEPLPPPEKPSSPRRAQSAENLEIARSGSLDTLEPAALLLSCHRAHLSGQVRLDQGLVQRRLFFDEGRLVGAASSSPDERLEALSYRRGLISREQQRMLRAETQIPTRRLALLMVERAYLKSAELFPLVQERVEEVLYEGCGAFDGTYEILSEPVPDDERVALSRSPLALVTEGIRRKYLMDRLLGGLGGPATLLRPARGPELADYGLTARERRLAQSVDGLRNIEELLFESGNEPLPGLKILYALLLGRSVEVAMRGLRSDASSEIEARIDLSRVAEKYEQVHSANYFEVLGVSSSATAYEIEQSYDRLSREFQPGRFQDLQHPELPGQVDEIQRLLAEARDILVDEGLREEYRAHLRR